MLPRYSAGFLVRSAMLSIVPLKCGGGASRKYRALTRRAFRRHRHSCSASAAGKLLPSSCTSESPLISLWFAPVGVMALSSLSRSGPADWRHPLSCRRQRVEIGRPTVRYRPQRNHTRDIPAVANPAIRQNGDIATASAMAGRARAEARHRAGGRQ